MTVNQPNHEVKVQIGPRSGGSAEVPFDPGRIEMVRVLGPHGHPHVLQSATPGHAVIEVYGASPDSEVTITFYVEGSP